MHLLGKKMYHHNRFIWSTCKISTPSIIEFRRHWWQFFICWPNFNSSIITAVWGWNISRLVRKSNEPPKLTWTPTSLCHHATTFSHRLRRLSSGTMHGQITAYVRSSCPPIVSASSLVAKGRAIKLWSSDFKVRKRLSLALKYLKRTHIIQVFADSGEINNLLNIVLGQDFLTLWTNARSFKDSRRSECTSRKNDQTWSPGYEWLSSTFCSSNCIVNIFNSDCTCTPDIFKIIKSLATTWTRRITHTRRLLALRDA